MRKDNRPSYTINRLVSACLRRLCPQQQSLLRLAISLLLCGLWGCSWGANKDFLETVKGASRKSLQQIIGYGDALLKENDTEGALVYYMVAANRIKPNMDKAQQRLCATANLKAGNVYYNKGRYADALQFYTKGLKIGEACDDKQLTGELYKNIGNIYCEFYDYAMGLSYFKQGYKIAHQYDTRDRQHRFLVNMTSVCTMMGDIKAAKKYYAESEKTKNPSDMVNVFMGRLNLGNILDSEHHYARSIPIYKQLVSYGMKHAVPPRYVCTAYQQIYLAYMQLNRLDSALYYAKACSQTAAKSGLSDKFIATMEHFAEIYERMGNGALASKYKSVYLKRRDSIYNMREYNRAKNDQFLYDMERASKQIDELNTQEQQKSLTITYQRRMIWTIMAIAVVIAILLVVVYRQKKALKRSYHNLFRINRDSVESQKLMRERLRENQERIGQLEAGNSILKQQHSDTQAKPADAVRHTASQLNDTQQKQLLKAIIEVMENSQEIFSTTFSIDKMAELVGSNRNYVSQVINEQLGKNFSNFVNEYRIQEACLRLNDTANYGQFTMRAIGESVGFKSYTTFVSVFRKLTGLTPAQYQKEANG